MKKQYVGTCVDSFDEDGDCIVDALPFNDVTDFAYAVDNAQTLSKAEFLALAECKDYFNDNHSFYKFNQVVMLYNDDLDIHHFFI
jgi:hypothetical protein